MSAPDSRDESFEGETNSPFYFNTSHWRAVDGMLEGVRERAGMMLLTGPTGSGKTMIMRAISEGLDESTPALFLQYASLNFREFINFLHTSLRVEDDILDAPNKAVALREFLYVQAKRGETGVVFIDEAHNLEPDVLKMLPKLSRFDTLDDGTVVGLQFVLIANDDLRDIMADSEYGEVRAKIAVDHTLRFFTRGELKQFLTKRLAPIARMTDEPITEEGIAEMGRFTGGSPRLIGMICSHTMLFAAENPGRSIDAQMVREAADALMLSPVDDPFASEESDAAAVSGLFSEADLSGEERAPADLPVDPLADSPGYDPVETIYPDDDTDPPPLHGEDGGTDADDTLYSKDHEAMAANEEADPSTGLRADARDEEAGDDDRRDVETAEPEDFDPTAFERAMEDQLDREDDPDFDDDEDFDEYDDENDENDEDDDRSEEEWPDSGAAPAKPSVRKGGAAFLSRLGWRSKSDKGAKLVRTGRRKDRNKAEGDAPPAPAPAPAARRGPKARVVGAREKKMKMAAVAATAVAVLGLGYAAVPPAVSAIGGMMASSPPPAAVEAPALPLEDYTASALAPMDPEAEADASLATENRGWGARVVVAEAPAMTDGVQGVLPIPDAATGAVKGALDLMDRALGAGARNSDNDKVGGILSAASDQITGLRDRVTRNGMTPEQISAEADALAAKGDAHFEGRRYIAPKGGNAYDTYRDALALQPDNAKARAGITRLREHFAEKANGARAAQQWDSANGFFETAIAISNLRAVK